MLRAMAANPDFVGSLAVAGETGTLQHGMKGTAAQGRCRGKTGTLHDVANVVGYCTARDGHTLAFAFLMNSVDPAAGHPIEDRWRWRWRNTTADPPTLLPPLSLSAPY